MEEFTTKQEEAQENKHRKQTAGTTSACRTHVVSGNLPIDGRPSEVQIDTLRSWKNKP
jgi:hypothetical protein